MRIVILVLALLFPSISSPQSNVWSLELLERYAAWIRDAGFDCPAATRVTEEGREGDATAFKVVCSPSKPPAPEAEVPFRLTMRPNASPQVLPWQEK